MLTSWYIDKDPTSGFIRNNFYPRNEVTRLLHTRISDARPFWWGHSTFEPNVLYKETDPIIFKQILSEVPSPKDNNIFILQIDNVIDEIFNYDITNPLNILPDHIIDWLRYFEFVKIVFFDAKEFNDVNIPENICVAATLIQRTKHKLQNDVIYLNSGSNTEELVEWGKHLPQWMTFLGSPFYPQLNFSNLAKERFHKHIYKARPGDSKFITHTYPVEKYLDISKVTKKFLMYVGRPRFGRVILAYKIIGNISDKNILYRINRPGHKANEPFYIPDSENDFGLSKKHRVMYNRIMTDTPAGNIDLETDNYESELWFLFPHPETYQKIFLDIVHETFSDGDLVTNHKKPGFSNSKVFITEKIFKPLITLKPFIVNANPGYLKHLRNLGFKTFGKFWDEQYDEETSYEKRTDLIVNILKKLDSMSKEDLENLHDDMKPILLHNRKIAEEFIYGESVWVRRLINHFKGSPGFKKINYI